MEWNVLVTIFFQVSLEQEENEEAAAAKAAEAAKEDQEREEEQHMEEYEEDFHLWLARVGGPSGGWTPDDHLVLTTLTHRSKAIMFVWQMSD